MITKLKNIARVKAGNSAPNKDTFSSSGVPFVRAGSLEFLVRNESIENCEKIGEAEAKSLKLNLFPRGSILFAKSGMSAKMGRVYQLPSDAFIVSHLAVIIPDESIISSSYLKYYFIGKPPMYLIRDEAYPSIRITDIEEIEIDLPDLETQNKIVAILDKASALVQKRQQTIDLLDELLRAQFLEMFGDSYTNPKNWEQLPLESIVSGDCPLTYGIVQPGQELDEGTPIVRPVDLTQRVVGLTGLKKIDPSISEKFKRTILKGGEILMCVRGTTGVVSIASPELAGANVTRGITPIWFDDKLDQEFAYHLMISKGIQYKIRKKTYGIALQQINLRDLRSMEFIVPPKKLQTEFVTKSNSIFKVRDNLASSLAKVDDLQNSIMQRAFSGKLSFDVSVELDALLEEIDLQKPGNDLFSIITNEEYLFSLVNRLNNQEFESQDLYDKAKHVAFQLLKEEERLAQEYDEQTQSLKLVVK